MSRTELPASARMRQQSEHTDWEDQYYFQLTDSDTSMDEDKNDEEGDMFYCTVELEPEYYSNQEQEPAIVNSMIAELEICPKKLSALMPSL